MTSIVRRPALTAVARAMTEDELQTTITELLDRFKIRWHHETDSRRSKSGLPDLIIVGRQVEFWELKAQGGKVTSEQGAFLSDLVAAGVKARVVRPMDLLDGSVVAWVRGLR